MVHHGSRIACRHILSSQWTGHAPSAPAVQTRAKGIQLPTHLFAYATDWYDTFIHDVTTACPPHIQLGWCNKICKHRFVIHNHDCMPADAGISPMKGCHTGDCYRKEAYLPVRLKDWHGSQPACCGFLVCTCVAPPVYWPCAVSPLDRLHCWWQIPSCTGVIRL